MNIINYKEQKDGSAIITLEYSEKEGDIIRVLYGVKKITNKLLQKFVVEALERYIEKDKK